MFYVIGFPCLVFFLRSDWHCLSKHEMREQWWENNNETSQIVIQDGEIRNAPGQYECLETALAAAAAAALPPDDVVSHP